ncbi:MAG: hypothetical protein AB1458_09455 [Bacteroidota bacterium]
MEDKIKKALPFFWKDPSAMMYDRQVLPRQAQHIIQHTAYARPDVEKELVITGTKVKPFAETQKKSFYARSAWL